MGSCCGKKAMPRAEMQATEASVDWLKPIGPAGPPGLRLRPPDPPRDEPHEPLLPVASTQCPTASRPDASTTHESGSSRSESSSESDDETDFQQPPNPKPSPARSFLAQRTAATPSTRKEAESESKRDRIIHEEHWGPTDHTSCTEFRIRVPLSLTEFEKAMIHAVNEGSKQVTGGGSGVEVVRNEPFGPESENNLGPPPFGLPGNAGLFTEKIYRMKPHIPGAIRVLLSNDLMTMDEGSWNAYPLCKTVVTNRKWTHDECLLQISTLYTSGGDAEVPNALSLPPELLRIRKVVHLDITDDGFIGGRKSANYKAEEDPKLLVTRDGRGPFLPGWEKGYTGPQIVIYKVVVLRFRFRFVESRIRSWALDKSYPSIFARLHRFALCSYDVWSRLSLARLREMEMETNEQLAAQLKRDKTEQAMTFEA